MNTEGKTIPNINQIIEAQVDIAKMSGFGVKLADGSYGFLRYNEIDPEYIIKDKTQLDKQYYKGKKIKVKIIGQCFSHSFKGYKKDTKEVSVYRIISDPWDKTEQWCIGDIKPLKVTSVSKNRAMGIIETGIDGFAEFKELDRQIPEEFKDFAIITAGDCLAGKIEDIDHDSRLVKIALTPYIYEEKKDIPEFHLSGKEEKKFSFVDIEQTFENEKKKPDIKEIRKNDIRGVLIVDDDKILLKGLSDNLQRLGIKVKKQNDFNSAVNFLNEDHKHNHDMAIIDIHLSEKDDYRGLSIANLINNKDPRCIILLISGTMYKMKYRMK